MKKGINQGTIDKLENLAWEFDDQIEGYDDEHILLFYRDMLSVREDMRQQAEPIDGRFICAEDNMIVIRTLDALHSIIMRRADYGNSTISGDLRKLAAYLKHGVSAE